MKGEKDLVHELVMTLYILLFVSAFVVIVLTLLGLTVTFELPWNY